MEQTEETPNVIPTDQVMFPTRYLWGAPFVMITYLYYGVNSDFIIIDEKNTSAQITNCVAHALMRTVIATYIACIVNMIMKLCQKRFGFGPDWTPYIRTLDMTFYVAHAFVPSEKVMRLFYGTSDTTVKQPMAMIIVTGGLLLVMLVIRTILYFMRNPKLLQQLYESVTGVSKPSETPTTTNNPRSLRQNDKM